jgi:hypothetical protein
MSVTIDGSDNSSYGFPYFHQKTHGSSRGHKLRLDEESIYFFSIYWTAKLYSGSCSLWYGILRSKLYAGIMHGQFMSVFTYSSNLEGGSNVQIEVLHRMLEQYKAEGKKLPPTLWVQMDNTCKWGSPFIWFLENNMFDFSYMTSVLKGITRIDTLWHTPKCWWTWKFSKL